MKQRIAGMSNVRTKIAAAATILGLGGLAGFALSANPPATEATPTANSAKPEVVRRTIHRTRRLPSEAVDAAPPAAAAAPAPAPAAAAPQAVQAVAPATAPAPAPAPASGSTSGDEFDDDEAREDGDEDDFEQDDLDEGLDDAGESEEGESDEGSEGGEDD